MRVREVYTDPHLLFGSYEEALRVQMSYVPCALGQSKSRDFDVSGLEIRTCGGPVLLRQKLSDRIRRKMKVGMSGVCALLLGFLWLCSGTRVYLRIPPHEQVARVARFITHQCDWASMATISSHQPVVGQPFSNTFSVSDGPPGTSSGVPYMYVTRMEVSVQDLELNQAASLSMTLAQTDYCRQQGFDPQSPLCARVILSGSVVKVNDTEAEFAKKCLFSRHPEMIDWPTDHNWYFAKFNISQVWVLDYFGGVKTVTPDEYFQATPYRK